MAIMKKTNIFYWVSTILFAAFMAWSGIPGIKPDERSIQFMHDGLGYPIYFIQFISAAKVLGAIAILVPGFNKIKEWAYAGLFFDLAGATFSGVAAAPKFDPAILGMLMWIVPGILSYIFWKKKINMAN